MRVLVDTCVLSEVRRPRPDPRVAARLAAVDDADLFVSAVTVGELVNGIARLPAGKRRRGLEQWLAAVEQAHADRILAWFRWKVQPA